ncbi:hypothetical protein AWZ03_013280 [Drosophila navojoa]|uniref:Uncharacterized protein n=1 Tax=Drosophila navojoa TaxID=7232 RepID=A0A484AXF9_DRONA|nr:hypothetical protein AWZ03_013280 [Drosophila navojoa]
MASWQPTNSISSSSSSNNNDSSNDNNGNNSNKDNNKIIAMESIRKTWQRAHPFSELLIRPGGREPTNSNSGSSSSGSNSSSSSSSSEAIGIVEESHDGSASICQEELNSGSQF